MKAIILADRKGTELLPLTDNTCLPLLPIVGKSILEHTLDALIEAGIRQAHIVVSAFAPDVKASLGNGEKWGMTLSYSTSRGGESPDKIIKTLSHTLKYPCLILRGDILRPFKQAQVFVQLAEANTSACCVALAENDPSWMLYCREWLPEFGSLLVWPNPAPHKQAISLPGRTHKLDSLIAFHQANLDAASGRLTLRLPGNTTAIGLRQGRRSKIYPQNIKQGIVHVGASCSTYPSVQFKGEVVIGDNVIIDRCAVLENTVVLPNTYIGELVELKNAVVRGNDLIRVDIGSILKVRDAFLLADLKTTPLKQSLNTFSGRLLGGALLLSSLPLWLIAGIKLLIENPEIPISFLALRGNKITLDEYGMPQRSEFICGEFNLKTPVLRYLPRLLAVFSGDLRLVGVLPVTPEVANQRQAEWEKQVDQAPAGLIGPTQLTVSKMASAEEKLLSDSFYWAHFSTRQDLQCLLQGLKTLFSAKAWS